MPRINPGLLLSEEDLDPEKLQGRRIACRRNCTATGNGCPTGNGHSYVPRFSSHFHRLPRCAKLFAMADDRWWVARLIRGKSEHHTAACRV